MKYTAHINVMPHKEILDPQGKAVQLGLSNLGIEQVEDVRVGKRIVLKLHADSQEAAQTQVEKACRQLLTNLTVEQYEFELTEGHH